MSEKKPSASKANGPPVTTASVVLLVESDVLERVPKAVHLRTAGFNVVEAADCEEARRVMDSVPVNIVFADLSMPDKTNGLAFLRWLRKHHPNIEAIITSETDMPLEGYGMFLSEPYRLADPTARIPASGTGVPTV
jgi:two-component system, response regulator PdtaR